MKLHNVPFSPPDMTEAEVDEVRDAILSGWITTGPRTKEFEKRIATYVSVPKAVCLNSQTACGEMALRLLGIGDGDEVIVPAYTYSASASVVCHMGAKLVMVDVQKDCLQMDYDALESAITEKTKAIIPVDLGGVPCDYDRIFTILESKKGLFHPANELQRKIGRVIVCADGAHAFGASWHRKMIGSVGDFTSFSFHAVKNLTTAEGGALTWHLPFGEDGIDYNGIDEKWTLDGYKNVPRVEGETWNGYLYRLSQLFSLHGQNKDALAKTKLGAWEYDIIGTWYKCNMTDIMAAIGLVQLGRYPQLLKRRREIIGRYDAAFKPLGVEVLDHYNDEHQSSGHLYITRIPGVSLEWRQEIIVKMAERGIACNVHYKPLPMMTAYKDLGFDIAHFPNSYDRFENEITLPLHTSLTDEDVEYVIDNYCDILKSV